MSSARGNWLALLDADDGFAPDRLARLVALGEARGADIVVDNLRLVTAKGRVLGDALRRGDPIFAEGLTDRKSVVSGKSVSVRVDLGGRRFIKNKKNTNINRKQ